MRLAITTDTHFGASNNTQKIHEKFLKKLMKESFDVLVHAGDIASHKQKQLYRSLQMFKEAIGERPLLFVEGNHCLWSEEIWGRKPSRIPYEEMKATQREWFSELKVHYLQDGSFSYKDEAIFYGYDGWYHILPPTSNDKNWMPRFAKQCPIDQYLSYRANKSLDAILSSAEEVRKENKNIKLVCTTHHSLTPYRGGDDSMGGNPRHLDFLSENFDLVINGHSHQEVDQIHEYVNGNSIYSCRIINAGSDYDKPKYKIIEL